MPRSVVSSDGTPIAFDLLGEGPPLVVVSGILCDRRTTQALAGELARQFSVVNYDRRGRETAVTPSRTPSPERSRILRR